MKLVINQYDNSEQTLKMLNLHKEDMLLDVVFAIELGFTNEINSRTFFHSHIFCFHYCIDFHNGKKNLSFEILSPHEKTDEYCYWGYTCNFYKENAKSKKIEVENAKINVAKVDTDFKVLDNESFHSVTEKIKTALWNKHENLLKRFEEEGILYPLVDMDRFSTKLKDFIYCSYDEMDQSELKVFIKEYEFNNLNNSLIKNDKVERKIKI
jgi:hypothetical protein